MEITEKYINKQLDYLDKIDDESYGRLVDKTLNEQALLSTFVQQNLDNIYKNDDKIKDFTYNMYFFILFLFKNKMKNKYPVISKEHLDKILNNNNFENPFEDLGDFIFTQYLNEDFDKESFLEAISLLNVVITTFVEL